MTRAVPVDICGVRCARRERARSTVQELRVYKQYSIQSPPNSDRGTETLMDASVELPVTVT